MRARLVVFVMLFVALASIASGQMDADPGIIKPDSQFHFIDVALDGLEEGVYGFGRFLRVVDDEVVAEKIMSNAAERKAELNYLEDKGRVNGSDYDRVREQYRDKLEHYRNYTRPKLNLSYSIDGFDITITVENNWTKEIGYVTGGVKMENLDTGETRDYEPPTPYPLDLKPGETKTVSATIPKDKEGTWKVHVDIDSWNGRNLIEETYKVEVG